jgi:hypothetical protein
MMINNFLFISLLIHVFLLRKSIINLFIFITKRRIKGIQKKKTDNNIIKEVFFFVGGISRLFY